MVCVPPFFPNAETPYIKVRPIKVNSAPCANTRATSAPPRMPLSIIILILSRYSGAIVIKDSIVA